MWRRPGFKWTTYLVALTVLGIVGSAIYANWLSRNPGGPLDLADIRGMGVPVSSEELQALAPSKGEDASKRYIAFYRKLGQLSPTQRTAFNDLSRNIPSATLAGQEKEANDFRPILQMVVSASELPRCDYGHKEDSVFADTVRGLTRAGGLLCGAAWADANAGKTQLALDELKAVLKIDAQENANPGWTATLRESRALDKYVAIMALRRTDNEVLLRIENDLVENLPPANARHVLYSYFLSCVQEVQGKYNPFAEPNPNLLQKLKEKFIDGPSFRRRAAADISLWKQAFPQFPKDPYDWETPREIILRLFKPHELDNHYVMYGSDFYDAASRCDYLGEQIAQRRLTLTAVRLLIGLNKSGTLPKTLPSTANSIDPFTKKPFIFKPKGKGFLIYSVGPDRVDNGGTPRAFPRRSSYDILVQI